MKVTLVHKTLRLIGERFFIHEISFKERELFKEELNLVKYQNKITELEGHIEELNKKMELIKSVLQ